MNFWKKVCIFVGCIALTACKSDDALLITNDLASGEMQEWSESDNIGTNHEDGQQNPEAKTQIVVHIVGAVNEPGVYELPSGSRVAELIKLAGGYNERASTDWLNQARVLEDGEQIYVPTLEEVKTWLESGEAEFPTEGGNADTQSNKERKVNINKATVEELMNLPGIGESKARSIVEFREQNGSFSSIEDLMLVPGIKEGVYNQIKDFIQV